MPLPTRRNRFWPTLIGLFAALTLACALTAWVVAPDTAFHLGRIEGLATHFREGGGYPLRLDAWACAGYGYATPIFYCDLFLTPLAAARALGAPLAAVWVGFALGAIAALVAVAAGLARWFGLGRRATLASVCLYATPCALNFFHGGALGTLCGNVFMPCVVFPAWVLLAEAPLGRRRAGEALAALGVGLTALPLAHLPSTVLAAAFLVALGLFRAPFLLRHPRRLLALAALAVAVAGLTAWFWLPLLEQWGSALVCFELGPRSRFAEGWVSPMGWFLPAALWQAFAARFLGGAFAMWGSAFLMWGWFLAPMAWVAWRQGGIRRLREAPFWVRFAVWACALILLLLACKPLLAALEPLLSPLQRPSRLQTLWWALFAPVAGRFLAEICTERQRRLLALCVALVFLKSFATPLHDRAATFLGHRPTPAERPFDIGNAEYLPTAWNRLHHPGDPYRTFAWAAADSAAHGTLTHTIAHPAPTLALPRFHYPGYAATLDGAPCAIRPAADGTVEVLTAGRTGDLRLSYEGTPLQRLATRISLRTAAILLALGGLLLARRARK